jgi:photosystem II stability/assembly factor-like uncharacterized protein
LAFVLALAAIALGPGAGAQPSRTAVTQGVVWVAAEAGVVETAVYRSTDGAEHWVRASKGLPRGISEVRGLVASPAPQVAYALIAVHPGLPGSGLYKTVDGGRSWKRKKTPGGFPETIVLDPTRPQVVYLLGGRDLRRSGDGGEHWRGLGSRVCVYPPVERLHGRTLPNKGWRCVTGSPYGPVVIDPRNPKVMYTTTVPLSGPYDVLLPMKSTDGGRTWRPTLSRSCWVRGRLAGAGHPCFRSRWRIAEGQANLPQAPALDARHPSVLYAAGDDGIYKTTDAGRTWAKVSPRRRVYTLAVDPSNSSVVWAAAYTQGGGSVVDKSTDGSRTWVTKTRVPYLYGVDIPSLAIDPSSPATVYLGGRGVLKTTNGGATWAQKNRGLPREPRENFTRQWATGAAEQQRFGLLFERELVAPGPLMLTTAYVSVPCGPRGVIFRTQSVAIDVAANGAFSYTDNDLSYFPPGGGAYTRWPGTLTLSGRIAGREIRGTIRVFGPGLSDCPGQIDSGPQSFVARCSQQCGQPPPPPPPPIIDALDVP